MNEDKATRYHRLRRRAVTLAVTWRVLLLAGLLFPGLSHTIRDASEALTAPAPVWLQLPLAACAWVLAAALVHEVGALPLAFYGGFTLDRRYGLSRQSAAEWWKDHVRASGVGLALAMVAVMWVYGALALWPARWWIAAWGGAIAASVATAWAAPVLLLPLFYRVVPLENEALRRRLLALADKARVPALGIFEWRLSDRTSRTNAALTGIGRTRRIIVSDTLVADYPPDEIEVILAHELAHHVHHDIWRGLAVDALVIGAGLWFADGLLRLAVVPLGLRGLSDIAGIPVIVLAAMAASLFALPAVNAVSRAHERRADCFALDTTRNAEAFISAMRRLGARNLAEEAPAWATRVFFYTHPPISDRLAFARAWIAKQSPRTQD
jgi:STE24 endopeptidase